MQYKKINLRHHAIQDSIEVSDSEIYDYVDQSINFFSEQLGSLEKALEFYNKPDEGTFTEGGTYIPPGFEGATTIDGESPT